VWALTTPSGRWHPKRLGLPGLRYASRNPPRIPKHRIEQLANRLAKIIAETRKLNPDE
jgi:hypothetical protein